MSKRITRRRPSRVFAGSLMQFALSLSLIGLARLTCSLTVRRE